MYIFVSTCFCKRSVASKSFHVKSPRIPMVTLSDFPETLWSWSMPYEMKILKIWACNYLPFLRYSQPKIEPLSENWLPYNFFLFLEPFSEFNNSFNWCHIKLFFQRWFDTEPILQKKYIFCFFFREMAAILSLKKTLKNIFFQTLRDQKSKIGCFYEFIPGFPKRLGRIVFEHWKWGYFKVVCKICGSAKSASLPFQKFWKKLANLGDLETNVDNLVGLWKFGQG